MKNMNKHGMIKPQYGLVSASIKFLDGQVWEITEGHSFGEMGAEELILCFHKRKDYKQVELGQVYKRR